MHMKLCKVLLGVQEQTSNIGVLLGVGRTDPKVRHGEAVASPKLVRFASPTKIRLTTILKKGKNIISLIDFNFFN